MTTTTSHNSAGANATWFRRYVPATDRSPRRLVCFPHAGGAAPFYRPMADSFAPQVEVLAVQYPGRQDRLREPCIANLETLADVIAGQMRALPLKPTVFFGHSMGAAVAFEAARRLERTGHGPRALIVSGRRAPSQPLNENIHHRDDDGVLAHIRELGGTETDLLVNEDILRMALPSIRADYQAIETYVGDVDRRVACPITALVGDADLKTDLLAVSAWSRHTTAGFRMKVLPGGHFYLIDRHAEVSDEIRADLDRCVVDRF